MITLIVGDVGSGKTLLMTVFTQLSNRICFTNYKIRNSRVRGRIKTFKFRDILDEKVNNSDVYLDEFYMYMDARKFMSDINTTLSYFAFQSRKLKLRMYLTTQLIRTIDVRMREMIDNIIECEYIEDKGFKYSIYNNIKKGYSAPIQFFLSLEKAKLYFNKYDTYQIIKTPAFENIRRNVAAAEFTNKEILKISKDCIKFLKRSKLKITKTNISVFCMKNNFSVKKFFTDKIYCETIILNGSKIVNKKK